MIWDDDEKGRCCVVVECVIRNGTRLSQEEVDKGGVGKREVDGVVSLVG